MNLTKIPAIERKPLSDIIKFQEKQLRSELVYLQAYSKYYKRLFKKHHIDIRKIKTLDDLQHIPVTTKDDLQRYNDDFICVPPKDVIDYMTTSGTLGNPITLAATDHDLERLAYNEAISFACAGATSRDIFQLMTTIDRRFMAGLAYFIGLRKLGAGIVRVGSGMPELHWETIQRFHPSYIVVVPSFILKLVEFAEANHIDYKNSSVKNAVCIGEPLRNPDFSLNTLGARIHEKWPIHLYSTYASTEMSAAFTECPYGKGGHLHPELIITEFLDENNEHVPEHEAGEITITTLGVEGMPLLRYKTGDVCFHHNEPCECGRNTIRLGPVVGRKQHMIKYKGTTLYPASLYSILDDYEQIENYVVEVSTNEIDTDRICIYIGCCKKTDGFDLKIKERFRAKLRVVPEIIFRPVEEINRLAFPAMSRKPVKFIDKRK
ncbi:MAG TPA: AMP-binding protein [Bacteroidales bacterium]|nr:AMP-binding protein [Bacteroidales bacterium]